MSEKRTLLITTGKAPVPDVLGGGVEMMTTELIKSNRIKNLDILSIYNKKLVRNNQCYKVIMVHDFWKNPDKFMIRALRYVARKVFNKKIYSAFYRKAIKLIETGNYDKVIIENNSEFLFNTDTAKYNCDFYYHMHNDDVNEYTVKKHKQLTYFIPQYKEFICVSNFLAEQVKNSVGYTNCKVIYNGINFEKFRDVYSNEKQDKLKRDYNINYGDKVYLYVGRIFAGKGTLELIRAYKQIKKENTKLLIVGAFTPKANEYHRQIEEEIKYETSIVTTGYIDNQELINYYAIADCFVLPTCKVKEAAGLVLIEAQSAGINIVAADNGGIKEYVNPDTSILVSLEGNFQENLSKALIQVEDKTFENMQKNKKFVEQFTIDKYIQSLLMAYNCE